MDLINLGIAFALVPFTQGLVQVLKHDKWSDWVKRVLTVLVAMGLVYLVRMSGIPEVSAQLANLYYTALTAIGTALIAMGLYSQQKGDIMTKIAKSESSVKVPSELMDAKQGDPGNTMPSVEGFPPVIPQVTHEPIPEDDTDK